MNSEAIGITILLAGMFFGFGYWCVLVFKAEMKKVRNSIHGENARKIRYDRKEIK